ncbi:Uncharacterised protein (plasmid) [Legionella adelaidensis]|uniref:Uncharacterized protein n=1 Tax=Legionella adelaidensis TaxID=45056 RepID=A0A0W0R642_9GAMM|nr:hypothetical protein [Legionella adelaidensis]KTC66510.1 hypothetical protein Lade_1168 [Legionella adelaidensis]VEH85793.1 Uncharacterised protein [Legionella adelaidensis]
MESRKAHRFFKPTDNLSYPEVVEALRSGYVVLMSRCAFSSEEEVRKHYPPKLGAELEWEVNAKPWYQERRHLYIVCYNRETAQLITSTAEPDKTTTPWTLKFRSDEMELTQLDIEVCRSEELWKKYNAAAVLLSPSDYPTERVVSVISDFRKIINSPVYSLDEKTGYDCQTGTRDILKAVNPSINPKQLVLPKDTRVLAYYSEQALELKISTSSACSMASSMLT